MKIEIYEKAFKLRKEIKSFEQTRDAITIIIDRHSAQGDMLDDNDRASRVNEAHIKNRNAIEEMIGELNAEFDAL